MGIYWVLTKHFISAIVVLVRTNSNHLTGATEMTALDLHALLFNIQDQDLTIAQLRALLADDIRSVEAMTTEYAPSSLAYHIDVLNSSAQPTDA